MLRIEGLVKSYGSAFTLAVEQLEIAEGTITALLGPNGSGKSTLLGLVAGLRQADRGSISMEGMALGPSSAAPAEWRRAVTMVTQRPFLFQGTVEENVGYGLKFRGTPRAARTVRINRALKQAGIEGFGRRSARELSDGEAQMVAIARALVVEPRILLLDEPTANIDSDNAARIETLIASLSDTNNFTVVFATHNLEQAYRLSTRVVSIIRGRPVPAHPENIFRGTVTGVRNGLTMISLRGGVQIEADTTLSGSVHVAIDPTNIIVSRMELHSSARNSFAGRLVSSSTHGHRVRLVVAAGVEFCVLVTEQSFREMALQPGEIVYVTFKSTAVRVF
jgi:molybdopterin-binding protein